MTTHNPSAQAALRGEPSYVWRAGQARRLAMIQAALPGLARRTVFVDGCGVGQYVDKLRTDARLVVGLDIEHQRLVQAVAPLMPLVCGAGEHLPFPPGSFDAVLSHEVLEHVQDDRLAAAEIVRVLRPGGRAVIFVPNRWYPFETHGIYWRGRYRFGNIPLVNYLPNALRNRLAPHVRAYTRRGLRDLFAKQPVRVISHTAIYGGYDNIIARLGGLGRLLRAVLQALESTPLRWLGLSHILVVERT